jgi:hypothetical protein
MTFHSLGLIEYPLEFWHVTKKDMISNFDNSRSDFIYLFILSRDKYIQPSF